MGIACHEKLFVHQMDVKCEFLHGNLNEDIYKVQPEVMKLAVKLVK